MYIRQPRLEVRTNYWFHKWLPILTTNWIFAYIPRNTALGNIQVTTPKWTLRKCWVLLKQLLHLIIDSYGSNLRFQSPWNTHSQVSDHLRILKKPSPFWDVSKKTCHQLRPEKLPRCTKRPPPCRRRYRRQLWRKLSMDSLESGRHFGWEIPGVSSRFFFRRKMWWISTEMESSAIVLLKWEVFPQWNSNIVLNPRSTFVLKHSKTCKKTSPKILESSSFSHTS